MCHFGLVIIVIHTLVIWGYVLISQNRILLHVPVTLFVLAARWQRSQSISMSWCNYEHDVVTVSRAESQSLKVEFKCAGSSQHHLCLLFPFLIFLSVFFFSPFCVISSSLIFLHLFQLTHILQKIMMTQQWSPFCAPNSRSLPPFLLVHSTFKHPLNSFCPISFFFCDGWVKCSFTTPSFVSIEF